MSQKHTPLPWYNARDVAGEPITIQRAPSVPIATTYRGSDLDETNASFIVRACNSHYDLLEALGMAVKLYEAYGLLAQAAECGEWVNKARAAIKKAEGEL